MSRDRVTQPPRTLALLAATALAGSGLGYAACLAAGLLPSVPAAWLAFAAASILAGCLAAVLMQRLSLAPTRAELTALRQQVAADEALLAARAEQQRRLRHDLRGALSPVMLVADRLSAHADPAVKRSADIMLRTVDRAAQLLQEPTPPADP